MPLTDEQYANCMRSMIIGFNMHDIHHDCTNETTTFHLNSQLAETDTCEKELVKMTITVNKPCSELRTCPQHSEDEPYHKWSAVKILKITIGDDEYSEEFDHLNTPLILWRNRLSPDSSASPSNFRPSYIRLFLLNFVNDDGDLGGYIWVAQKNGPWSEGDLGVCRAYYIIC